jgi:hypothetical protein
VSSFQYLEKISLGRGDPILRLVGGSKVSRRATTEPAQLVIRGCSSVTIGGMYKRALNCGRSVPTDRSADGNSSCYEVLCCVGCGVSELAWAILWEDIAISLASFPSSSLALPQRNSDPFSQLIIAVTQNLVSGNGQGSHLLPSSSLATLCHNLSQSYLEIPTLLLSNHLSSASSFSVKRELLLWKQTLRDVLFGDLSWRGAPLPPHCFSRKPFTENDNVTQELTVFSLGEAFFDGTPSLHSLKISLLSLVRRMLHSHGSLAHQFEDRREAWSSPHQEQQTAEFGRRTRHSDSSVNYYPNLTSP